MKKDTPITPEHDARDERRALRRRVLRGLAGVPAVLTLMPGAALAQSNLRCRTDENPDAFPPEVDPNTTTGLDCVSISPPADPPLVSANRTNNAALDDFLDRGPGTALRQELDDGDDNSQTSRACVAYIDQTGTVQSFDARDPNGGVAVTATCFVSFTIT